jgi:molybdate transport system regulatory protein
MTKVDLQIHISVANNLLVNPERIKLMRSIVKTGSVLKSSEEMGISYNKAWNILENVNLATGKAVIEKVRGGKGGGGAVLSDYGKRILKEYEAIEQVVQQFNEKLNTEIKI